MKGSSESYLVQSVPQGDLAGDESLCKVVVLLLQAEAGLLKPPVLPLQNREIYQGLQRTAEYALGKLGNFKKE